MDEKREHVLNLIAESIIHWMDNLEKAKVGKLFGYQGDECPLCAEFGSEDDIYCAGCPIVLKTMFIQCQGTPREDVVDNYFTGGSRLVDSVKEELKFLREVYADYEAGNL